jgi:hypothetical protein
MRGCSHAVALRAQTDAVPRQPLVISQSATSAVRGPTHFAELETRSVISAR